MTDGVSFQTRARTIDHLGRGQIADAPTAISELWKNAYDAYASHVSLHLFDGEPAVGAIFDDGVGMTRNDVVGRWLVVGTESKIEDFAAQPPDTLGLPSRPRQGEKGIGRLSVAFLAPATILLTKKKGGKYVAVVVDWRLFENPFLSLEDVRLPVEEFSSIGAVLEGLPAMQAFLLQNLGGKHDDRTKRLAAGWKKFSEYEKEQGEAALTADAIEALWRKAPLEQRHLDEWDVAHGLADHGTAMFMVGLNYELSVWVTPSEESDEKKEVEQRLWDTLNGFTDPYTEDRIQFDYEVYTHVNGVDRRIMSSTEVFGRQGLHELEHFIEGRFDEKGIFTGRVTAFGKDLGLMTITPARMPPVKGKDRLGPFEFSIGTFEQLETSSTHTELEHKRFMDQADKYAGLALYRDNLRVMPYGRPDADFLRMEERRSLHAGREFWSHRRSFGHVAFTRKTNPALRDKAGREGLVDNRAFREMRLLLIDVLRTAAKRYFGSAAPMREEMLQEIQARKAAQREAASQARTRRRASLRQFLKEQSAPLEDALKRAEALASLARDTIKSKDKIQATVVAARANEMRAISESLRPPLPPARLGDLEERWRTYRDDYQEFVDQLKEIADLSSQVEAVVQAADPTTILKEHLNSQRAILSEQLRGFGDAIDSRLGNLRKIWAEARLGDEAELLKQVGHLLDAKVSTTNLLSYLNLVDATRAELSETFSVKYRAFLSTVDQLLEGIDLEGAYAITEDDRSELEEKLRDINAIAQVGITVEIIGHEFETLEADVRRNLGKLPEAARETTAYKQALRSHMALADRLRFLSPLRIGGYRAREIITGQQIAEYLEEFFSRMFKDGRIEFTATKSFRHIAITDLPSRIFPVFINLVNNAIYWVGQADERRIVLDFNDGLVVLGDTGPGVDVDDVPRLFEIFFSRRRMGRGVGLYLTRTNLGVAGHKIRYAMSDDPKVLPGANFIIEFKGVQTNG
jgi:signal transduction histidine kinase